MSVHLNAGQIGRGTPASLIMFQKKNDCPFRSLIKYFLAFKCGNMGNLSLRLYNVCNVMEQKINVMDFPVFSYSVTTICIILYWLEFVLWIVM
jgi:hypothetical protein